MWRCSRRCSRRRYVFSFFSMLTTVCVLYSKGLKTDKLPAQLFEIDEDAKDEVRSRATRNWLCDPLVFKDFYQENVQNWHKWAGHLVVSGVSLMWSAYCANPQTRTSSPARSINSSHRSCAFLPSFRMQIISDRGLHLGSMIAVVLPRQRAETDLFLYLLPRCFIISNSWIFNTKWICVACKKIWFFFHLCTVVLMSRRYIVRLLF